MSRASESVKHYEQFNLQYLYHLLEASRLVGDVERCNLTKIMILSKEKEVCAVYAEGYLDAVNFDLPAARRLADYVEK